MHGQSGRFLHPGQYLKSYLDLMCSYATNVTKEKKKLVVTFVGYNVYNKASQAIQYPATTNRRVDSGRFTRIIGSCGASG